MLGVAGLERAGYLRTGARARQAGALSYPLYIIHAPLLLIASTPCVRRLAAGNVDTFAALLLVAILLASSVAAFGIDQPLQRRLRRLAPPRGRATAFDALDRPMAQRSLG